jgi:hypothetical protein
VEGVVVVVVVVVVVEVIVRLRVASCDLQGPKLHCDIHHYVQGVF